MGPEAQNVFLAFLFGEYEEQDMGDSIIHGVNLSGWLMLEPWITPSLFASTGALTPEQLAVELGPKAYANLEYDHRVTFITEADFEQIAARGFNAVRLPIPWRIFQDAAYGVHIDKTTMDFVEDAFEWAQRHNLLILLDVVVDPETESRSKEQENYVDTASRLRTPLVEVMGELAERFGNREAILGIEPLNEPLVQRRQGLKTTQGIPLHTLRNFYRDCYQTIRSRAGEKPTVVLSAAGRPEDWRYFMGQRQYKNVWLDLHLFQYTGNLDGLGPQAAKKLVRRSHEQIERASRSHLPIVVGEWSCALPADSSNLTPEGSLALERIYGAAQLQAYAKTRGWFFQTWKTEDKLGAWDARVALSSFEKALLD